MQPLPAPARTYRPYRVLVLATALASAFWAWAAWVMWGAGAPAFSALGGASVFSAFFAASCAVYARSAITVDDEGLTHRGMWRSTRARWSECESFNVVPGLVTLYVLRAAGRPVHFSNLYGRHRELAGRLMQEVER